MASKKNPAVEEVQDHNPGNVSGQSVVFTRNKDGASIRFGADRNEVAFGSIYLSPEMAGDRTEITVIIS